MTKPIELPTRDFLIAKRAQKKAWNALETFIYDSELSSQAWRDRLLAALMEVRTVALEDAMEICRQHYESFSSKEYATDQPLGSFNERFACKQIEKAIRQSIDPDAPYKEDENDQR